MRNPQQIDYAKNSNAIQREMLLVEIYSLKERFKKIKSDEKLNENKDKFYKFMFLKDNKSDLKPIDGNTVSIRVWPWAQVNLIAYLGFKFFKKYFLL